MGKLVNKTELSEIIGKTQKTLTTWQSQGMPFKLAGKRGTSNEYDTADVIDWIVKRELDKYLGSDGESYDLEKERSRLTHHQANKTALEEDVLKGELIPSDVVKNEWSKMVSSMRAKMLSLPTKAAHKLLNIGDFEEIESIMKSHIYEALQELSEYGSNTKSQETDI